MTHRVTASEAQVMLVELPSCGTCGQPSSCEYKGDLYCDDCCGHGGEDGVCNPVGHGGNVARLAHSVVALTAERDDARRLLATMAERVLTERRAREDVRNARTNAVRAAVRCAPYDIDAEPTLAAAEVQHTKALAALDECLTHQESLAPTVSSRRA